MRKTIHATAVALAALLAGSSMTARAADMSMAPIYQPESGPMVEFGTGWYLRGDMGYSTMKAPVANPPTYVNDAISPPAANTTFGSSNSSFGILNSSFGAGYQFNKWFRSDATFDWRQNHTSNVNTYGVNCPIDVINPVTQIATLQDPNYACYRTDSTKLQSWTGLLNFYGDLGNWFGLTPYIGGGVGITHIRADASEEVFWNDGLGNYGGAGFNSYLSKAEGVIIHIGYPGNNGPTQSLDNFSWALMAGVSYDIAPHIKFDIGYRYLNLGTISASTPTGQAVRRTVDSQEVRAGLRFTPDL
jgi:opacity protein-like surface antigen